MNGAQNGFSPPEPLPEGGVLLHVGLPKTGTTAIQYTASQARRALLEHGVLYPGTGTNHDDAVAALMGRRRRRNPVPLQRWQQLAKELAERRHTRAWISQERMASADAEIAQRFRDELGDRLDVVITVRPLEGWLPSVWQQYVKTGYRSSFAEWLELVLRDEPEQLKSRPFPYRLPSTVAAVWQQAARSVTVVVLDRAQPDMLYRSFEGLLALPPGLLQTASLGGYRSNRGLSLTEAEFLRRFNLRFAPRSGPPGSYLDLVRLGLVAGIQEGRKPRPDEPSVRIPADDVRRVKEIGTAEAARLQALGVHVVGRLDDFGRVRTPADSLDAGPLLPADIALEGMLGLFSQAAGRGVLFSNPPPAQRADSTVIAKLSTPRLALVILRRAIGRLPGFRRRR